MLVYWAPASVASWLLTLAPATSLATSPGPCNGGNVPDPVTRPRSGPGNVPDPATGPRNGPGTCYSWRYTITR